MNMVKYAKNIKVNTTKLISRGGLIIKKYSPEILLTVGIAGFAGACVMVGFETVKAQKVYENEQLDIEILKELMEEDNVEKDSFNYKKNLTGQYIRLGWNVAKCYIPAASVATVSVASILTSHKILSKRNLALAAAYATMEEGFRKYRDNVIADQGEEKDFEYLHSAKKKKVKFIEQDKDGKPIEVEQEVYVTTDESPSIFARFFDETSDQWVKNPELNLAFLRAQQSVATKMLQDRGHLFLNEVYDLLGLERSNVGALVGWVDDGEHDGFVDFGIYDMVREGSEERRKFINGIERSIKLDFNVDGVIYNKI